MISKELRGAWWKALVGGLLFLVFVTSDVVSYKYVEMSLEVPDHVSDLVSEGRLVLPADQAKDPVEWSISNLWFVYNSGGVVLALIAAVLGVIMISGEVSRGTMFLILSRPVGRTRVLLTKYLVGALALLVVALLGSGGLILYATYKGYPTSSLSAVGVWLSTALIWLGSLSVLGMALLVSVLFRDVVRSTIITLVAVFLLFEFPLDLNFVSPDERVQRFHSETDPEPDASVGMVRGASLPFFWTSENLYQGKEFASVHFLVCTVAAVLPLVVALWLFRRKAY